MDVATIIGLLSGIGLVVISILMGGDAWVFWNARSLVLVLGGTLASTLLNYPLSDLMGVLSSVKNAFVHKVPSLEALIERLVLFSGVARREGILALDTYSKETDDPFLEKSVQLAIDGTPPELLRDILTTELAFMEERHALGQSILVAMGTYAPAFGMIGTLIGLVQMFTNMKDASLIGAGMAVAILTTLYGALLAYVLFLPAAGKLKVRTANELLAREIVIEGVIAIQCGDSPRVVEQKLKSFVGPALRQRITGNYASGAALYKQENNTKRGGIAARR